MYNKSYRKHAKIHKRKYNYLQDLYGNSETATTDLQRRNTKLFKNFNQIKNALRTYEIKNKRLRNATPTTKKVSISYNKLK